MTRREYRNHLNAMKRHDHVAFIKRSIFTFVTLFILVLGITFVTTIRANANDIDTETAYKYYKQIEIVDGDTLVSIASENLDCYYYTDTDALAKEIKEINGLKSGFLKSGMVLMVPYYDTVLK